MSPIVGAWGKPQNRKAKALAPGPSGGMNAQGSPKKWTRSGGSFGPGGGVSDIAVPQGQAIATARESGKKTDAAAKTPGPIKPSTGGWQDPQYRLSMAGHQYDLGRAMAEQARNIAQLKNMLRTGKEGLTTDADVAQQKLGAALGSAGFGRSGVLAADQAQIKKSLDRQMAELIGKYGSGAQDFERRMAELARQQFTKTKVAEKLGAKERLQIRQGELM